MLRIEECREHGRQSPQKMEKLTEASEIYQKNKNKNFALEGKILNEAIMRKSMQWLQVHLKFELIGGAWMHILEEKLILEAIKRSVVF